MPSQPTHPASRGATAWMAAGLFLSVLFVATSLFKVAGNFSMPEFDPQDPTVFYWSESAVQYRHARMVAEGQGIPAHDVALQYPEGVRTFRTLTVLMEYPAGWTYRLLRAAGIDVAFYEFLVWWVSFFYSLALVPAYVLAWRLYRSHLSAVVTTLLYTLSLATIGRQFGTFGREHFALPWLFTALALLVMSLAPPGPEASRRRQWAPPIAAAAALVVGLAAWHFSRFIFLVLAASLSAAFLFARREHLPRLARTLGLVATLNRSTFFTRDSDFYKPELCHARYCLVFLAVHRFEAAMFIRRFLRHPHFNTRAKRGGRVVRVSTAGIQYWERHSQEEQTELFQD